MNIVGSLRILCITTLIFLFSSASADNLYPLETKKQEVQFQHLLKELRCLVCQNQDLSDSHATLAKDVRKVVWNMVKASKSDAEIREFLTERYGDFILFNPPIKPLTWVLWFGPPMFLIIGFAIFLSSFIGRDPSCKS